MKSTASFGGFLGILFSALSWPVSAQDPGFTPPSWTSPPDPDLAAQLLPGFASVIGQDGWATVRCLAFEDGHPFLCEAINEKPAGMGFGSAARLVVASGEVAVARRDGHPVQRLVTVTVRFDAYGLDEPSESWTGREPTLEGLALAKRVVETEPTYLASTLDDMLGGLDVDRRPVVRDWITELLPDHARTMNDAPVIQTARIYREDELRAIMAGEQVPYPEPKLFDAALPDLSPEQLTAVREIRRRYCERWDCDTGS